MEKIRIVIADADMERRIELKKTLFKNKNIELAGEVENPETCLSLAKEENPDLLILSIPFADSDPLELIDEITVESPQSEIVLIAENMEDRDDARKLTRHGARDFMVRPVEEDEILDVVKEVVTFSRKRQERLSQIMTGRASGQTSRPGKVISVFSTKGGVGRSLLAANLACMIRELTEKRVALVDFDLQFGDASILMDMTPTNSIASLARDAREEESVDLDLLEIYMHTHEQSGVDLLPAPPRPEEADYVGDEEARKILDSLRRNYEYVIIDTSSQVTDSVIAGLENSDLVLLLLTLELPTIKNGKLMLELMDSLGLEQEMVRIVMNRDTPGSEIQLKEIEDALEQEIIGGLPSDGQNVMPSIDEGIPVVISQPRCDFNMKLRDLTKKIIREEFELEEELLDEGEDSSETSVSASLSGGSSIAPGQRILSGLIDYAIGWSGFLVMVVVAVVLASSGNSVAGMVAGVFLGLLGLAIPLGYLLYFHSMSRSVGLRMVGGRLVDEDGSAPGFVSVLVRVFVESALPGISHVFMFLDENNQALHDRLSNTFVIRESTEQTGSE